MGFPSHATRSGLVQWTTAAATASSQAPRLRLAATDRVAFETSRRAAETWKDVINCRPAFGAFLRNSIASDHVIPIYFFRSLFVASDGKAGLKLIYAVSTCNSGKPRKIKKRKTRRKVKERLFEGELRLFRFFFSCLNQVYCKIYSSLCCFFSYSLLSKNVFTITNGRLFPRVRSIVLPLNFKTHPGKSNLKTRGLLSNGRRISL